MDWNKYSNGLKRLSTMLSFKHEAAAPNELCCLDFHLDQIRLICLDNLHTKPRLKLITTAPYKPETFANDLTELVAKNHLQNKACTWILATDKYHVLNMDALPVLPEEFQAAIRWQIRKLLPYPVEDAYIDSIDIPTSKITNPKKMIMVITAQMSYVQPMTEIINNSGLKLIAIDIPDLAWRNVAALYDNKDDKSIALVYLQDKHSNLIIVREKLFYLSRRLDWHLETFLKNSQDADSMHRYLDSLALEIHRSFDYFQSQWRAPAPTQVLMVPERATPADMSAYLSQRLAFPVHIMDLNQKIECKTPMTMDEQGGNLTLIGGALREKMSYATTN